MAFNERNLNYYWKQASFAGGLYGSHLWGRDDLARYAIGAKTMTNFYPYPYGGFSRRLGTKFVNECKLSDKPVVLVPFVYSSDISFVLEFGDKYIRIYRDGGIVMNGDKIVEVDTSYSADSLYKLKYVQSADRMYLTHPDYPIMTLSRYSDIDWRLEAFNFKRGPFRTQNATETTLAASGTTGNITVTASNDVFTQNMVGGLIRISHNMYGQQDSRTNVSGPFTGSAVHCSSGYRFQVGDPWSTTIYIQISNDNGKTWGSFKSYSIFENGGGISDSGTVDHPCLLRIMSTGSNSGTGSYTFSCDAYISDGFAKITSFTDARHVNATVYTDDNNYEWGIASTNATKFWSLGAWSKEFGYPATCAFYQDRLWFGGTSKDPLTLWYSQSGNYDDFYTHETPQDDDGGSFSLASGLVNKPISFLSLSSLVSFTQASEWVINSGSAKAAITPNSVNAVQQTTEGSSWLDPLVINDRALFVTKFGDYVRDMAYDYSTDSYKGDDLTLYNRDLFDGYELKSWCSQKSPDNIIWACRSDGKLLSFTYIYDQKVQAWSIHETQGSFENCVSIPGDSQDEVYFVVKRTINGVQKRYIEMMAHRYTDLNKLYYLDSYLSLDTEKNVTEISGLNHLEGMEVGVMANGSFIGTQIVRNGHIQLMYSANHVVVGLMYTSDFQTLDIPLPRQDGTSYGRVKKVSRITLKLKDSYGGQVGINGTDRLMNIDQPWPKLVGGPSQLYNTDYKIEPAGGAEPYAYINVRQSYPYPLTVLTIMAEVAMG